MEAVAAALTPSRYPAPGPLPGQGPSPAASSRSWGSPRRWCRGALAVCRQALEGIDIAGPPGRTSPDRAVDVIPFVPLAGPDGRLP
jgi:hypothetical protein